MKYYAALQNDHVADQLMTWKVVYTLLHEKKQITKFNMEYSLHSEIKLTNSERN